MSIQPPSDIVLDVAQAADPAKSMAAAQRLSQLAASNGSSGDFSGVLENLAPPLDKSANLRTQLELMGASPGVGHANQGDPRTKAYKGLEALIFQNLFETTLPHDESLGQGMAGDVWRSMMAEQLGKQTASIIDLGLLPKSGPPESAKGLLLGQPNKTLPLVSDPNDTGSSS